jgi:AraC-like DNA-binding protein
MTTALKNVTASLKNGNGAPASTVGAGYARGLLEFAVSKGAGRRKLLELSRISPIDVEDLDARIPLPNYVALFKAAAQLLEEPAIALQYGEAVRMQEISIVGLICEACERTIDVGVQLNRYGRLMFDHEGGASDMVRGMRDETGFWMEGASAFFSSSPFVVEAEFARLVWNTRTMFKNNAEFQAFGFPAEVHFTHPEPSYLNEYDRIFQAPLVFGAKWNAMRVDPRFLALRQPPVNRYVFGVLSERAEALLKSLEASKTTRGRVEALLIPDLHKGDPSIERIAEHMGLSRQTLYRKLKAEGATFEKLLDELRHKMALHYLNGKKVSVNETAYLVGFSEPSAFSRAFRRWTGTSPRKRAVS